MEGKVQLEIFPKLILFIILRFDLIRFCSVCRSVEDGGNGEAAKNEIDRTVELQRESNSQDFGKGGHQTGQFADRVPFVYAEQGARRILQKARYFGCRLFASRISRHQRTIPEERTTVSLIIPA